MEKLTSLLIQLDVRESRKRDYNPYALGQYLKAAEGVTDAKSFSEAFNPTPGMNWVAKEMGYSLGVDHGEWVSRVREKK